MKKIICLILLLLCQNGFTQEIAKFSSFHRLLVFNQTNQLMVVKIKNTDFWVTPGWYQDEHTSIKQGLNNLAKSYGLLINSPQLRGVFALSGDDKAISTRFVYSASIQSGVLQLPEDIEMVKWLPIEDAIKQINFPHIRAQISQITAFPDIVWGGAQTRSKDENGHFTSTITEDFYPLSINSVSQQQQQHQ